MPHASIVAVSLKAAKRIRKMPDKRKLQFERMLPGELDESVRECPVAWLPIGTLEWHGPHLPVGLDALKAHALCLRIAERAGGVVLPPNYFSILGMTFPWTFRYSPVSFSQTFLSSLRQLKKYGFKVIFAITGHYPMEQVLLLMALADTFMTFNDTVVVAVPEFAMAMEAGYYGDHAAKWETSLMMELYPELVGEKELSDLAGLRGFGLFGKGIQGANPSEHASRDNGAEAIRVIVGNFSELAGGLVENPDKSVARKLHRDTIAKFLRRHAELLIKNLKNI
jgi:creatinine amidohydrolase